MDTRRSKRKRLDRHESSEDDEPELKAAKGLESDQLYPSTATFFTPQQDPNTTSEHQQRARRLRQFSRDSSTPKKSRNLQKELESVVPRTITPRSESISIPLDDSLSNDRVRASIARAKEVLKKPHPALKLPSEGSRQTTQSLKIPDTVTSLLQRKTKPDTATSLLPRKTKPQAPTIDTKARTPSKATLLLERKPKLSTATTLLQGKVHSKQTTQTSSSSTLLQRSGRAGLNPLRPISRLHVLPSGTQWMNLSLLFASLDQTISIRLLSSRTTFFDEVQKEVQSYTKLTFNMKHLWQIMRVQPGFFEASWVDRKRLHIATSATRDKVARHDYCLERRQLFDNKLLRICQESHKRFGKPAGEYYHPDFVQKLPDISSEAIVPKPSAMTAEVAQLRAKSATTAAALAKAAALKNSPSKTQTTASPQVSLPSSDTAAVAIGRPVKGLISSDISRYLSKEKLAKIQQNQQKREERIAVFTTSAYGNI